MQWPWCRCVRHQIKVFTGIHRFSYPELLVWLLSLILPPWWIHFVLSVVLCIFCVWEVKWLFEKLSILHFPLSTLNPFCMIYNLVHQEGCWVLAPKRSHKRSPLPILGSWGSPVCVVIHRGGFAFRFSQKLDISGEPKWAIRHGDRIRAAWKRTLTHISDNYHTRGADSSEGFFIVK